MIMMKYALYLYMFFAGWAVSTATDYLLHIPLYAALYYLIDKAQCYLDIAVVCREDVNEDMMDELAAALSSEQYYQRIRLLKIDLDRLEELMEEEENTDG